MIKTNYTKNGKNYYRITKTIGHKSDGAPVKKEFYGESKKVAEKKADDYIGNIRKGLVAGYDRITVEDLFSYWVYEVIQYSSTKKHSTFERYETTYRLYIKDSIIGVMPIYDIATHHIQNYYNNLHSKKKKRTSTIAELNKELKAFMNWCVKNDYRIKNPCFNIEIPGDADSSSNKKDYIDFFSYDEIKKFKFKEDNTKYICLLSLCMGLRQGEILALKNKDMDWDNNTISISSTLSKKKIFEKNVHTKSILVVTKPKTKSSIRTLSIPLNLIEPLKQYIYTIQKKWEEMDLNFGEDSLIFTTKTCAPIDSSDLRVAWTRLLKRSDIEYKRFHCLRHTFASILFNQGVSIKTVQSLLGHHDLATTEKIYVHVMPEAKEDAINKINIVL